MHSLDYFISLLHENRSTGFSLFGVLSHTCKTVDFSQDVNVPFPDILFLFELFEKESDENSELRFYALFNCLKFTDYLLDLGNQITTITSFFRGKCEFLGYFEVLPFRHFDLVPLFNVNVGYGGAFEGNTNIFEFLFELVFNLFFCFDKRVI